MDFISQFPQFGHTLFSTSGSNISADVSNGSRLANPNDSRSNRSSTGSSFLFRKQEGSSWITFYRSPSGEVKAILTKANREFTAYLPVKGLPYLKVEHIDRARAVLESSQIQLTGDQIEVRPRLKGGMLQAEEGPDSPRKQTTVFISYSWAQSKAVDVIEKQLASASIRVIRDKQDLQYRDELEAFMKKAVQNADYAIMVISPAYLESRNCMYELYHLMKEGHLKARLFPITISKPDEQNSDDRTIQKYATEDKKYRLREGTTIQGYEAYWQREIEEREGELKSVDKAQEPRKWGILQFEYELRRLFKETLSQTLRETFATQMITISFEALQKENYQSLKGIVARGELPQPTSQFTGRESVLENLRSRLLVGSGGQVHWGQATKVAVIRGLGGVGKTQIARKFAQDQKDTYRSITFFDSETELMLYQSYQGLAQRMGLDKDVELGKMQLEELKAYVHSHLKATHEPWLFVFDNLSLQGDQAWMDFEKALPKTGGSVLITTRSYTQKDAGGKVVPLVGLEAEAGLMLLKQLIPKEKYTEASLKALAEALGHLPVSLSLAGKFIAEQPLSTVENYLSLIQQGERGVFETHEDPFARIESTCKIALESLDEISPSAKKLLGLCANLAAVPIPIEWFYAYYAKKQTSNLSEIALKLKISRDLKVLEAYSLITVDEKNQTFALHRLVQATVRDHFKATPGSEAESMQEWASALDLMQQAWDKQDSKPSVGKGPAGNQLLVHTEALAHHGRQVTNKKGPLLEKLGSVLTQAGAYAKKQASYFASKVFYERAVTVNKEMYGAEHPTVAANLNTLGTVYTALGEEAKAKESFETALSGKTIPFNRSSKSNVNVAKDKDVKVVIHTSPNKYADVDVHAKNEKGETALHLAAEEGDKGQILALLAKGADIESKNNAGNTPLRLAASKGHTAAILLLLDKGANIEAKSNHGSTPLHFAASNEHKEAIEVLLAKGAQIEARDNDGSTPLHFAASNEHKEAIELLLAKGAQIEAKDNDGYTPLHWAAYNGHKEAIEVLLAKGAQIEAKQKDGSTPLHWAAQSGHKAAIELLLAKGADVEAKNAASNTPLHWAAYHGHKEAIEVLLAKGAQIESKSNVGNTALNLAAQSGHKAAIELLLAKGADVEAKNAASNTPLHLAALNGHKEVVELLLAKGTQIEAKQNEGHTPLHLAVWEGHTEAVKLLLQHGANMKATNTSIRTAIELAKQNNHTETVKLLSEWESRFSQSTAKPAASTPKPSKPEKEDSTKKPSKFLGIFKRKG